VPVHGEALHLSEHAALARAQGVPEIALCGDGDVLRLAPGPAEVIDQVPFGRVYRDGQLFVDAKSSTISERRKLSFAGVVSVALALGNRGELLGEPEVEISGLPEFAHNSVPMENFVLDAIYESFESMPKQRRRDPDAIEDTVSRAIRGQVNGVWGKKPMCHVLVLQV
jgi:ribonuclease J